MNTSSALRSCGPYCEVARDREPRVRLFRLQRRVELRRSLRLDARADLAQLGCDLGRHAEIARRFSVSIVLRCSLREAIRQARSRVARPVTG